jgi:hypothetical protein
VFLLAVTVIGTLGTSVGSAAAPGSTLSVATSHAGLRTLAGTVLVSAPPNGSKGPDDITYLSTPSLDWGRPLVWVAFQNGINPNGTPGTPGGPLNSTVAGFDPALGVMVRSFSVLGKVDGLTADPGLGKLIATVNEDDNSALRVIDPATGHVTNYTYSPNPAVSRNGGTDSVAIWNGQIYTTHSNPNDTTQATEYLVTLRPATHVAALTPVFFDDNLAKVVQTGKFLHMALTDPDTNAVMPAASPRFAGDLATISQQDGRVVFTQPYGTGVRLHQLNLTDNVSGNLPPLDGFAVAAAGRGTLYVVDNGAQTVTAFNTAGWAAGTVFVDEASDNGNPLIGTLNLSTGKVTPFANHFVNPHGMIWVPAHPVESVSFGPLASHDDAGVVGQSGVPSVPSASANVLAASSTERAARAAI